MTSPQFIKDVTSILAETFLDLNKICEKILSQHPPPSPQKQPEKSSSSIEEMEPLPKQESEEEVKEEKKKKRKKKVIDGKPKPPPNAFVMYLQEKKNQIQLQHQKITIAATTAIASKHWHEMTPEEKAPYHQAYEKNKQKYNIEKTKFYKEHPEHDPENRQRTPLKKNKNEDELISPSKRERVKQKKKTKETIKKENKEKIKEQEEEGQQDRVILDDKAKQQ